MKSMTHTDPNPEKHRPSNTSRWRYAKEHPMHGTLSSAVRVADGKGGHKLMKMKKALQKGLIKLK